MPMMDTYQALALRSLEILKIQYDSPESLSSVLQRLRAAIMLPGSTTEGEIMLLSKEIADLIENRAPVSQIESKLKDLDSLALFNLFD